MKSLRRHSSHANRKTSKYTVHITSIRAHLDQNPGGVKQLQLMVHRHKKRLYTKPSSLKLLDNALEVSWPLTDVLTLHATLYESKAGKDSAHYKASGFSEKNYMVSLLDCSDPKKPKELYRGEINLSDRVARLEELQGVRIDLHPRSGVKGAAKADMMLKVSEGGGGDDSDSESYNSSSQGTLDFGGGQSRRFSALDSQQDLSGFESPSQPSPSQPMRPSEVGTPTQPSPSRAAAAQRALLDAVATPPTNPMVYQPSLDPIRQSVDGEPEPEQLLAADEEAAMAKAREETLEMEAEAAEALKQQAAVVKLQAATRGRTARKDFKAKKEEALAAEAEAAKAREEAEKAVAAAAAAKDAETKAQLEAAAKAAEEERGMAEERAVRASMALRDAEAEMEAAAKAEEAAAKDAAEMLEAASADAGLAAAAAAEAAGGDPPANYVNLADMGTGGAHQHAGWLKKRSVSATHFKNWRRRWIAVGPDAITWHLDESARVRGSLPLAGATLRGAEQGSTHPPPFHLTVIDHGGKRELVLEMGNHAEHQEWVQAIQNASAFKRGVAAGGDDSQEQRGRQLC